MYRLTRINLLILLLFSCLFITNVNALVLPTSEFYVNDYANVLSPETEKYIIDKSKELYKVDGTQIVVVTVRNLENSSIEDYSLNLAREFGIGSKDKNNGLLILLALDERESRIEVGTGLEGILPDGKTGRFQDQYMIPYFKTNDFDTGIKNGYDAFFNEIVKLNNLNLATASLRKKTQRDYTISSNTIILIGFVGFVIGLVARFVKSIKDKLTAGYLIIGLIILLALYKSNKIYFFLFVLHMIGFLIGRFVTLKMMPYSVSGSGGGYSGGYSSRSHSSHSSGGGGGFSGGGSSRKF